MRLLLCLRYGAGRYIMIKANFQALRLCALIIPAEIRVCIIAAKTRANIDHLYAALPHAGKINCPLPFAHINSPIKLRAGWRKRKSHHAQKGKQQNSAHQSTERSVTFFPIPFLRLGPNFNWRDHRQPLAVSYAAHLISVQKNSRKMICILRLFFKNSFYISG